MPELPEVETIVRGLRPVLLGKTFRSASVGWNRSLALPDVDQFLKAVPGQTITGLNRRGKFIILTLSGQILLVHLRMSGDLRLETDPAHVLTHDHIDLHFEDGTRLVFNDPRKFGRMWLVSDPAEITGKLGPEPLDPSLSDSQFHLRLVQRHRQLKPLLLDQEFIAGLGNIYTDEALFLAGLHPGTPSHTLDLTRSGCLLSSVRAVLEEGIQSNGASIDWVYRGGDFQNHFKVYHRAGQACAVCGSMIQRMVIGQRGTHFCPVCQPLK